MALGLLVLLFLFEPAMAADQVFRIEGHRYYPLYAICRKKDIEYNWDSIGRVATLRKNGIEAKIRVGSDKILIDGEKLKDIGKALFFYNGIVLAPSAFANSGIDKIFKYKAAPKRYVAKSRYAAGTHVVRTIVLDPGHGGKDPGAIGRYYGLKEKEIVLDIAKRLKKLLSGYGIKVYLTRENDTFIPLWKRAEFADRKRADFFISIHANAHRSKWVKGFEVYYLSEATDDNAKALEAAENRAKKFEEGSLDRYNKSAKAIAYDLKFTENRVESIELAEYLAKSVRRKIYVKDRGVKSARFHVLKNTSMPAILVEVGFISNKNEEYKLKSSSHRAEIAKGLANGIFSYKKAYEKSNGFSR